MVAEAIALTTYITTAQARRDWLVEQIAHGGTGPAAPATQSPTPSGSSARSGLFALGGALLGLAGVFFLALAWAALPLPGRVVLILVVSGALVGAGHRLTSRLRGTAETLTTVGVVLAVAAGFAAPDLFGTADQWGTGARSLWYATILAVTAGVAAYSATRSPLRSWPLIAVAATALAAACATVSTASLGHFWPVAVTAGVAGIILNLVPALLSRLMVRLDPDRFLLNAEGGNLLFAAAVLHLFAATIVAIVGTFGSERLASAAIILGLFATPALFHHVTPTRKGRIMAQQIFGTGAGISLTIVGYDLLNQYAATALVAVTALALLTLARDARAAHGLVPAVLVTGFAGVIGTAVSTTGPMNMTAALACLAVVLTVTGTSGTTSILPWRDGLWLAAAFGAAAWWYWLADNGAEYPVEAWTVPAATLLILAGAAWSWRGPRDTRWHHTDAWLLPGMLALGAPGAFAAMTEVVTATDPDLTWRAPVYLIAGALVAAIGGRARISALLKAGTITVILASVGQITTLGRALPGWGTLALAGALVLTAAIRWEWLQEQSSRSRDWAQTLR